MTSQKNHQKSGLFIPITVFILLFLLFGAIGFVSASFDGNGGGTDKPISDPACWFWFFVFGGIMGFVGFVLTHYAGSIIKWWHEPGDKQKRE